MIHLLLQDHKLYAASELGQHCVWDLSVFHQSYCDLLREVWKGIPVLWVDGLPVRRPVNRAHRCAR